MMEKRFKMFDVQSVVNECHPLGSRFFFSKEEKLPFKHEIMHVINDAFKGEKNGTF